MLHELLMSAACPWKGHPEHRTMPWAVNSLPSAVAHCFYCAADGACCCGEPHTGPSEGVVLAGGSQVTLVAGAGKGREHRVGAVLLQGGALLDSGRVLPKQVGREGGVPVILHLIVCVVEVAMEGALQASAERQFWASGQCGRLLGASCAGCLMQARRQDQLDPSENTEGRQDSRHLGYTAGPPAC